MKVFNDLTNKIEEFIPINPPEVRMYVCGPTVYDVPHLGHARSEVAFDLIRRYLEYKGYKVIYVHNYTDVDDKMIKRSNEKGITIYDLAKKNIMSYEEMQKVLGVKKPTYKPRATEEIDEIIKIIKKLEEKGFTYQGSDGTVYFDTSKFKNYSYIFQKSAEKAEAVGEANLEFSQSSYLDDKRNPADFALWKSKKEGEPSWRSPWGEGRPGWHIECTAMSMKYLGETIDIHGGGKDLKRPHHQNEIAQSEAYSGKQFVKYWLHNGFLNINNTKMSKSLGNFIPLQDLLKKYSGTLLRYYFLSSYYRRPMDFTMERLSQLQKSLNKLHRFYNLVKKDDISKIDKKNNDNKNFDNKDNILLKKIEERTDELIKSFFEAMDFDFNTAKALGFLFALISYIQKNIFSKKIHLNLKLREKILKFLNNINEFFDFIIPKDENIKSKRLIKDKGSVSNSNSISNSNCDSNSSSRNEWKEKFETLVKSLIILRRKYKKEKNYAQADAIRDLLKDIGIQLIDNGLDTTWSFN